MFGRKLAEIEPSRGLNLVSLVKDRLLNLNYQPRIVRHLDISFSPLQSKEPTDLLIQKVRSDLAGFYGPKVAARIRVEKRPLSETYPEDTLEDLETIRNAWKRDHFEVPSERYPDSIEYPGFDDMYMTYGCKAKGKVSEEEKGLMREHNRKLLTYLKELGWENPEFDPNNLD